MFVLLGVFLERLIVASMSLRDNMGATPLVIWSVLTSGAGVILMTATSLSSWRRRFHVDGEWTVWALRGAAVVLITAGLRIIARI